MNMANRGLEKCKETEKKHLSTSKFFPAKALSVLGTISGWHFDKINPI